MESSCLYKISCKIVNLNQIKIIFKIYNSYKKILDDFSNEKIKNNPKKDKIIETRKVFEAQIKGLEKDILSYSESEDILNELNNTEVQEQIKQFKGKNNIGDIDERLNILFKLLSKYKSILDKYTNEKIIDNPKKVKIIKTRKVFEAQIKGLEKNILEIVKKNQINTNNSNINNSNINNRITEFISNSRKENKQRNEEANKTEKAEANKTEKAKEIRLAEEKNQKPLSPQSKTQNKRSINKQIKNLSEIYMTLKKDNFLGKSDIMKKIKSLENSKK